MTHTERQLIINEAAALALREVAAIWRSYGVMNYAQPAAERADRLDPPKVVEKRYQVNSHSNNCVCDTVESKNLFARDEIEAREFVALLNDLNDRAGKVR